MYQGSGGEQLRELSSNDLNFLETSEQVGEGLEGAEPGRDGLRGGPSANSTVCDLENILDKFEADTQLLLDNPNQLLNCK